MSESNFAKKALPEWQKEHPNAVIMRNNTGMAWQGIITIIQGYIGKFLSNIRPIFFGVGLPVKNKKTGRITQKGGGDYIGWESIPLCDFLPTDEILDFVRSKCKHHKINEYGNTICEDKTCPYKKAIFLSMETKSKDNKESPDQIKFRKVVQAAGGIAIVLKEGEK